MTCVGLPKSAMIAKSALSTVKTQRLATAAAKPMAPTIARARRYGGLLDALSRDRAMARLPAGQLGRWANRHGHHDGRLDMIRISKKCTAMSRREQETMIRSLAPAA